MLKAVKEKYMSVNRKGRLVNPNKQAKKFATQLKKREKNGQPLTDVQAGYRMGYLGCRRDEADIYNAKKKRSTRAKKGSKKS